ncbi:flagellar protein FliT [Clostridium gasigenes]|uniref:flagellar protein FliT n=1 Tax=Clostridium gasigenes TaxID=94869 RepID=UPI0014385F3A|nr:flagellar protein FliT [Clostridium gasigenes]NKF06931.1 flagellar protein FliT [Clostridium gasigenes]QSW19806.1 flagellar protein FliT [Clostridium gasigenes]
MDLRELLEKYKSVSLDLIKEIKEEANAEELMEERQNLLNKIVEIDLSKEEKIKIGKEFDILNLEKQVKEVIEEEQRKVKEEIRKTIMKKQANRGYGANLNSINFFNTKV